MLERHLEVLEDYTFSRGLSRNQHLEAILNSLDNGDNLSVTIIERILAICVRDLKEDLKHAVFCINIINKILKRYQLDLPISKLVESAKVLLNFLLTAASLIKAELLHTICFNALLAHPEDVLAEVASSCNDMYELIGLYCHLKMPVEIRFQPIYLVHKVMKHLTSDKREIFVKKGLAIWFSKVVPFAMDNFQTQIISTTPMVCPMVLTLLELLELLTEDLSNIDYSANAQWQTLLENIYNPNEYPAKMKNLLLVGSDLWHRIWIIFIKLLKGQITMIKPGIGSPINSMLPVVEMAFKMDIANRCRAFQCWSVLIDNFSAETNELFMNKRTKLLIIPLRSNNAKVEETALAKLDTWWHLIKQYENRLDDRMLYPFLHFCFGRHVLEKAIPIPGMMSSKVKKKCVEAFVEMVGHVNCEGCGSMTRLKNKLISTKVLVDHWNDWLYSLKMAIKVSAEDDTDIGKQPITCAWKSFAMTIAELPENNLRKDLFNDLLTIIKQLAQESPMNRKLAEIITNVLISSLLEETTLKQLLKSKEYENGPIHTLVSISMDPTFAETCKKYNIENISKNLKLITNFLVQELPQLEENIVIWLLADGQPNDHTLLLWTAIAEAMQISKYRNECQQRMCNLLLWPLKNLQHFTNVGAAALTWYNTYCEMHLMTIKTSWFHVEFNRILANENNSPAATFFTLCILLAVVKTKIIAKTYEGLHKDLQRLQDVTCQYTDYKEIKVVFPILIDTLGLLLKTAVNEPVIGKNINDIFLIGKKALDITIKQLENGVTPDEVNLLKVIDVVKLLFKTEGGNEFKTILLDALLKCRSLIVTTSVSSNLESTITSILSDKDQSLSAKVKATREISQDVEFLKNNVSKTKELDLSKFTSPVAKNQKRNTKKKEASIVNTVVENGEEFAVIKSNWKFNPRKLTENQKEKFQKKREDIPALYQDLSQSQDEFKLKSWKTDSQDASTTNSRSASTPSNDNISSIKNMSGKDIVPRIIDNFFSDSPKGDAAEKKDNNETDNPKPINIDQAKSSPSVRTPRMALKDRVFRNVRNLIEKSTVRKEGPHKDDLLNKSVNVNIFDTPVTNCKETKNANSAPSKIPADRPARLKRIPKKFDDTEIYSVQKKRRNSANQNELQSQEVTDVTEGRTSLTDNNNEDVNNTLKVATVAVENLQLVDNEVCKLNTSVNEPEPETNLKKDDTNESNLMVAEVSSSSVSKDIEGDTSNGNVEENIISSQNDISADESLEQIQQPEHVKEITDKDDTSTLNHTSKTKKSDGVKSTTKKKSRIEKQLAIDMVDGLVKLQSDKRVTRKCSTNTPNSSRRRSLADKLNKSKTDPKSSSKPKKETSSKDLPKGKSRKNTKDLSVTVCETQDISATQDLSEDVIESSQDTTTTISVKSFRSCTNKPSSNVDTSNETVLETQNLIDISTQEINSTADVIMSQENKDDTELPANKTDVQGNVIMDLTEEMDTEPTSSEDVIFINDDTHVIDLNTNDGVPGPGPDTLELANADTEPTDPSQFGKNTNILIETNNIPEIKDIPADISNDEQKESVYDNSQQLPSTADDRTITLVDISQNMETGASSPSIDDDQRKKDFLNNTSEISPIKSLSPIEPKSPSPETSSDYLVIRLSGPVQPNGEPLEMSNSPEIFTEERISPDKRDQSPPRPDIPVTNSSPSSSLSLKKNRPQVRSGGRAAQMLGLCVPDRLQTIMQTDRPEAEEPKKSSPVNTPARRNLRMLYQTAAADSDSSEGKEESEQFLKFKKTLPAADCSPSGPILKRKLADITDEATVSPANKRKRVSFHDPVSTSVSVQKYIESSVVRSPQNSALKRLERQLRHQSPMKSSKRLESLFKLDSILTKAVESFNENDVTSSNDTELSSLDETPIVELVKTSELNDTDPIYSILIDCNDPIDNIASELSSPGMRLLLVKELEGKIETVGDLAKLTELEVNRICIKAPKVQVAKQVLADYASRKDKLMEVEKVAEPTVNVELTLATNSVEIQTNILTSETETQTSLILQRFSSTQTDAALNLQKCTQTNESGEKSTEDIIKSCLRDRKDFVLKLSEQLEKESKFKLAETLPVKDCTELLLNKMPSSDAKSILENVIRRESELQSNGLASKELSVLQNYMSEKFDAKDLILFCSQMLQKVYDKGLGD